VFAPSRGNCGVHTLLQLCLVDKVSMKSEQLLMLQELERVELSGDVIECAEQNVPGL
jgi:hypothetical protein